MLRDPIERGILLMLAAIIVSEVLYISLMIETGQCAASLVCSLATLPFTH